MAEDGGSCRGCGELDHSHSHLQCEESDPEAQTHLRNFTYSLTHAIIRHTHKPSMPWMLQRYKGRMMYPTGTHNPKEGSRMKRTQGHPHVKDGHGDWEGNVLPSGALGLR